MGSRYMKSVIYHALQTPSEPKNLGFGNFGSSAVRRIAVTCENFSRSTHDTVASSPYALALFAPMSHLLLFGASFPSSLNRHLIEWPIVRGL